MKLQRGFTLIELMIVVTIVAVLAAVAIPSYQQHLIKSNRAAAESFMLQAANREEQIMLDMRNYVAVTSNANFSSAPPTGISLPVPDSVSKFYTLTITISGATYTISATPTGSQLAGDTCGTLGLDQTGLKGQMVSGTLTALAACWV